MPSKRVRSGDHTDLFNDALSGDLFGDAYRFATSPAGRAIGRYAIRKFRSRRNPPPMSPLTPNSLGTSASYAERKSLFRPSTDGMQLMKRKMNTRLNKDRSVAMAELYNALYPKRSVVVESSFQMFTATAQKMTCMNVFRHQDLGVLDECAATFAVSEAKSGDKWADVNISPIDPQPAPVQIEPGPDVNVQPVVGQTGKLWNRTVSGYVMRGYGVNVQNNLATGQTGISPLQVQGQMYIGPGNHCSALACEDPPQPQFNVGQETGIAVYGAKDNIDPARFLGVFSNWRNNVPPVQYPNIDALSVSVGELMGCCQTLWSPVCAQSIEAASANLGFNTLGVGTVASRSSNLNQNQQDAAIVGDFGPKTPENGTNAVKVVPRDVLDPVGTHFTWTKHSTDYKVTNTYSYPVEVEFIVYKVGGLTSRDQVGPLPGSASNRSVTEYYPGLNGPLPYTSGKGGIFNIFFGDFGTQGGGTVNRSMILDFMSGWQQKIRQLQRPQDGIQLPMINPAGLVGIGSAAAAPSAPNFQIATRTHWPLTNARWRSFQSPRGVKSPFEFMREFSRKTIKLQSGEICNHRIDLGGFKYSLQDVGYTSQRSAGGTNFKAFPIYSQNKDYQTTNIQYAERGLMNGSVVVALVLKGTTVSANAPIPRSGPSAFFPSDNYGGSSINGALKQQSNSVPIRDHPTGLYVDRGYPENAESKIVGNFASGSVRAAASLLVECKESIEFQPMMNKRAKMLHNSQTHTNKSLLITASTPVSETVRTVVEGSTDNFTSTNTHNNMSRTYADGS